MRLSHRLLQWLIVPFFSVSLFCAAQTTTPNIGLEVPVTNGPMWQIQLNYNWSQLDLFLSGNAALPGLDVTGTFLAPTASSFVTTQSGQIGYDSTANNWHFNANAIDSILAVVPASTAITNNDCVSWIKSGTVISLGDAGAACGAGAGTSLLAANNLSDLVSVSTARTNLGLGSAALASAPTSAIVGINDTQALTNKSIAGSEINSGVVGFPFMAQLFTTNAKTATYQAQVSDFLGCTTIPVASGTFTITLVASGTQPASGQCMDIINYGTGTVTIARSGQNINGGVTSLTIGAGTNTAPMGAHVVSDGTNYEVALWASPGATGMVYPGAGIANSSGSSWNASYSLATFLQSANNLSELTSASTARTNLGLGSAAVEPTTYFLQSANNLADVTSAITTRVNLGLGSAATQASSAFDIAGAATTAQAASLQKTSNLSDLASESSARTNLGLGSAALATAPTSAIVGTSDTQTLTNKSIAGSEINSGAIGIAEMAQLFVTNAQTATYLALAADFLGCKTIPIASGSFTITLVATGTQPASGQCLDIINYGTGTITIARNGQNLNGGTTSLTIPAGTATAPNGAHIVSDGTNYEAALWAAPGSGGSMVYPSAGIANSSGSAWNASYSLATFLQSANNLSDLASASTARTNLGLGSAATQASSAFQPSLGYSPLAPANNLSDVTTTSTARSNLGLGTAATASAPSSAIVGISDTQTLTNKSIAGSEINSSVVGGNYGGTGLDTATQSGIAQVLSGTWSISGILANGTEATTQTIGDNTTKLATDAFVLANIAASVSTGSFSSVVANHYLGNYYAANGGPPSSTYTGSALFTTWNLGGTGEGDFIDANGGASGGFNWYFLLGSTVTKEMWMDSSAVLHVPNGIIANVTGTLTGTATYAGALNSGFPLAQCVAGYFPTGIAAVGNAFNCLDNIAGNAATATAFAATPTNCGTNGVASGVQANGNANCNANIYQSASTSSVCTTGGNAYSICGPMTLSWPVSFGNSSYPVTCQVVNPYSTIPFSSITATVYVIARTASSIGVELENGDTSSADPISAGEIDCIGVGPHA